MNGSRSLAAIDWHVGICDCCGATVAVIETENGTELKMRVTDGSLALLERLVHPAYSSRARPLLTGLADRSVMVRFEVAGEGMLASSLIGCDLDGDLRETYISPVLALLLNDLTGLTLEVDEALTPREATHFVDVFEAFGVFVAELLPDDFIRYEVDGVG